MELRRIHLLGTRVNRGDRLDPTPHLFFVAQVLFAELPLQVALLTLDDAPPDDLAVLAATVPGPVETRRVPDLTHTLRRQPRAASLRHYRGELRRPVDPKVLATVVAWCRDIRNARR